MKKLLLVLTAVALLAMAGSAMAGTDTTTVTFQVDAIYEIGITGGDPAALVINTATAGAQPDPAQSTSSYDVTTTSAPAKITGQITTGGDMPANTTLNVTFTAPTGGTSAGAVSMNSTVAQDLVTAIPAIMESNIPIVYDFIATAAAGVIASDTRVITYTISN